MIEKFNIGVGAAFAAYGLIGLVGIWLVPTIGNSRLFGSTMLTGNLTATRANRTFMALWSVLCGACSASLPLGLPTAAGAFILGILLLSIAKALIWYRLRR